MHWDDILDYADRLGLEFKYSQDNDLMEIFRGNNKYTLEKKQNTWVLRDFKQNSQFSPNPYQLLQITV
jgi:hypothetical protein